jgi:hypothetical protein
MSVLKLKNNQGQNLGSSASRPAGSTCLSCLWQAGSCHPHLFLKAL